MSFIKDLVDFRRAIRDRIPQVILEITHFANDTYMFRAYDMPDDTFDADKVFIQEGVTKIAKDHELCMNTHLCNKAITDLQYRGQADKLGGNNGLNTK